MSTLSVHLRGVVEGGRQVAVTHTRVIWGDPHPHVLVSTAQELLDAAYGSLVNQAEARAIAIDRPEWEMLP